MTITTKQKAAGLPEDWTQTNLGNQEFFDLIMGQSPSSETYTAKKTGLPFLQGNADFGVIHPNPKTYCTEPMKVAEKDDVLISVRAPVGEVNIATEQYCIGRGLGAIRPKDKHDSKYLYYFLNHYRHDLERMSAGSTFKAITKDDLEKFSVTLPPLEEKQKIISILTTVDDAVQRSRQAAAETERLKAGVMQELMTKGIGHTEFREDEDVGRVPKEWEISRLDKFAEIIMGQSPSGDTYNREKQGMPLINGPVEFGIDTPTPIQWTNAPTKICKRGDILFCVRGNTTARINIADQPYCIGRGIAAIRGMDGFSNTSFIKFAFTNRHDQIYQMAVGGGSTFPNITSKQIGELKLAFPSIKEQDRIATILSTIDRKLSLQRQRTAHYERLKQGLMNELLTGKRRVQVM